MQPVNDPRFHTPGRRLVMFGPGYRVLCLSGDGGDMSEWQPIETAPKDGTPIQAKIPGHGNDNVIAWHNGFVDSQERECAAWVFLEESQEPPDSWTDGVCWDLNEDEKQSVKPTHWMPLPEPPQ